MAHGGEPFIAPKYMEGKTLKERAGRGPLENDELFKLGMRASISIATTLLRRSKPSSR